MSDDPFEVYEVTENTHSQQETWDIQKKIGVLLPPTSRRWARKVKRLPLVISLDEAADILSSSGYETASHDDIRKNLRGSAPYVRWGVKECGRWCAKKVDLLVDNYFDMRAIEEERIATVDFVAGVVGGGYWDGETYASWRRRINAAKATGAYMRGDDDPDGVELEFTDQDGPVTMRVSKVSTVCDMSSFLRRCMAAYHDMTIAEIEQDVIHRCEDGKAATFETEGWVIDTRRLLAEMGYIDDGDAVEPYDVQLDEDTQLYGTESSAMLGEAEERVRDAFVGVTNQPTVTEGTIGRRSRLMAHVDSLPASTVAAIISDIRNTAKTLTEIAKETNTDIQAVSEVYARAVSGAYADIEAADGIEECIAGDKASWSSLCPVEVNGRHAFRGSVTIDGETVTKVFNASKPGQARKNWLDWRERWDCHNQDDDQTTVYVVLSVGRETNVYRTYQSGDAAHAEADHLNDVMSLVGSDAEFVVVESRLIA